MAYSRKHLGKLLTNLFLILDNDQKAAYEYGLEDVRVLFRVTARAGVKTDAET